jgi:hypothetical protein
MENNVVREVVVISNEVIENKEFPDSEPLGIAFCKETFGADTQWLQTSYNANFRGKYAGLTDIYDPTIDEFVSA